MDRYPGRLRWKCKNGSSRELSRVYNDTQQRATRQAALFYGARSGFDLPRSEGNQHGAFKAPQGGVAGVILEGQERKVK